MAKQETTDRYTQIRTWLKANPDASNMDAARHFGVGEASVRRALKTARDDGPAVAHTLDIASPVVRAPLVRELRKGWVSYETLKSRYVADDVSLGRAIHELKASGYLVEERPTGVRIVADQPAGQRVIEDAAMSGPTWRFGVISDTHLCNKHARLDVAEAAYDEFAAQGIDTVYHAGNMVDGEFRFNRYELLAHGITDQTMYVLDHYPQRSGITTRFIIGDCHEGWWMGREGIDWGRYMSLEAHAHGRDDFEYIGYMEADVELRTPGGSGIMRVFHPGGGTAYAMSYKPQKIVESLQGGEKPGVLICGHYHKLGYWMVRNVHVVLAGCAEDQTSFMRKRHIEAHVGWYVMEVTQDGQGAIRRVSVTNENYFDRSYHVSVVDVAGGAP